MARLATSLRDIDSRRVGGCQKPKCKATGILHRHHRRHEAMWFGVWSGRRRTEVKWKAFVRRYYEFHPDDYEVVCPSHHAEIHIIYDVIISKDREEVGRPLSKYSWKQANILMDKLEQACFLWLRIQTPGIDHEEFRQSRTKNSKNAK